MGKSSRRVVGEGESSVVVDGDRESAVVGEGESSEIVVEEGENIEGMSMSWVWVDHRVKQSEQVLFHFFSNFNQMN